MESLSEGEPIVPRYGSKKRIAFCIVGVILLYIALVQIEIGYEIDPFYLTKYDIMAMIFLPIGFVFTIQGSYWWAKEKGRSGWWSLMGLLAPFGYIALMKLKDKRSLKETPLVIEGKSIKFCPHCGHQLETIMNYCPNCGMEFTS